MRVIAVVIVLYVVICVVSCLDRQAAGARANAHKMNLRR